MPARFFHRHTHTYTHAHSTREARQWLLKQKGRKKKMANVLWHSKYGRKKMCWLPQPPELEKTAHFFPPVAGKHGPIHHHHHSDHPRPMHKLLQCVCASQRVARQCHQASLVACGCRRHASSLPRFRPRLHCELKQ